MKVAEMVRSFRGWSWILGFGSLVPVVFGIYEYWQFGLWASERQKHGEFICGTGIVAMLFLFAAAAGLMASIALLCGGISYLKTPKPRGRKRMFELLVVGNVFVLGFIAYLCDLGFNGLR